MQMNYRPVTIPEERIGDRLARARKHAGLSSAGMAQRIGVSRTMISRWEHGHVMRDYVPLVYAQICAVPVEWLVNGSTDAIGLECAS